MTATVVTTHRRSSRIDAREGRRARTVAYVMSRFPTLTETFVLYEILALENQGVEVDVYPLLRGTDGASLSDNASIWKKAVELWRKPSAGGIMHAEAAVVARRAHYCPFFSWPILLAQLHFLFRSPAKYLATLAALIRGTWGSPNFFVGGLAIFPKCVYFARQMQRDGVDRVHAHFANHPTLAAFVIHRLIGIPYSFTGHGSDLHRDQTMLRQKVREASFVVPISNFNRQLIARVCDGKYQDKLLVIHCGVDTRQFQPRDDSATTSGANRALTILCIGKMHEVKGQKHLIGACRRLQDRGVPFQCLFVGDGPDRTALSEQIIAEGLSEHVRLLGLKTRDQIIQLLSEADVVVAPSVPSRSGRREGIPVVLMEAMASGVPVIASELTGIPELVEHRQTGLLTPPGDEEALADAIDELYREPDVRSRLGQAGRRKVLEEFDLETNAALLAARFRQEEDA